VSAGANGIGLPWHPLFHPSGTQSRLLSSELRRCWDRRERGARDSALTRGATRCVGSKGVVLQQAGISKLKSPGGFRFGARAELFEQTGSTQAKPWLGFPAEEGTLALPSGQDRVQWSRGQPAASNIMPCRHLCFMKLAGEQCMSRTPRRVLIARPQWTPLARTNSLAPSASQCTSLQGMRRHDTSPSVIWG
jgi:hypothetical protein